MYTIIQFINTWFVYWISKNLVFVCILCILNYLPKYIIGFYKVLIEPSNELGLSFKKI
jgi:hypothetical protein